MTNKCNIDECEKKSVARGWCHTHYKRWQINGDPLFTLLPRNRLCTVDGCNNKHSSIGYCSKHERRFRRYARVHTYLRRYNSPEEAYDDLVIRKEGCWGWKGSISTAGYSLLFCNGKRYWGHRFSFQRYKDPIKNGYQICHHCDNPICSNPDHLFQGTQTDNMRDCIAKKRFIKAPNKYKAKGEKVSGCKLSTEQVIEIKKLIANGFRNTEIAPLFGVTHKNISSIRLNKTWKHIILETQNAK